MPSHSSLSNTETHCVSTCRHVEACLLVHSWNIRPHTDITEQSSTLYSHRGRANSRGKENKNLSVCRMQVSPVLHAAHDEKAVRSRAPAAGITYFLEFYLTPGWKQSWLLFLYQQKADDICRRGASEMAGWCLGPFAFLCFVPLCDTVPSLCFLPSLLIIESHCGGFTSNCFLFAGYLW